MIEEILHGPQDVPRRCNLKTRSRAAGPPEFRVVHPTKEGGHFDYPLFPRIAKNTLPH
jgi:hypothetical protein